METYVQILMVMASFGLVIALHFDKDLAAAFMVTAGLIVGLMCAAVIHSMEPLDTLLMVILCLDAAWVAQGIIRKRNMWSWIALYWVILTLKCLLQYLEH